MSSSTYNPLKRLLRLDDSSPKFHDQLSNTLYGKEYQDWVKRIEGDDAVRLVDYLDGAVGVLDPASSGFRKCRRELRDICGEKLILPTSYTLPSRALTISDRPFTSGGFGDVFEGELKGSKVCVKRIRMYAQDDPKKAKKAFYQEAVMWNRLTHNNIVPLLGITTATFQLVSEWMPYGTLTEYVRGHPAADRRSLLSDVAAGLEYLHLCSIVHGDLKGPNILMDKTGHARITDFGLATVTQNLDSLRNPSDDHGHSARWTAPEVLKGDQISKESDVFSFAMVMIEVFTGAVPYNPQPSTAAMLEIMRGNRPPQPLHPQLTNELWGLMQYCWNQDPPSRPEASGILVSLNGTGPPPTEASVGGHRIDEQRTQPSGHMSRKPSRHDTAASELSAVVLDPAQSDLSQLHKSPGNPVDSRADVLGDRSGSRGDVGGRDSFRGHNYDLGVNDKGKYRPGRRDHRGATDPGLNPGGMYDKAGSSSSRPNLPGNISREHLMAQYDQPGTNPYNKGKNAGVYASSQVAVRDPSSGADHHRPGEQRGQLNLGRSPSQKNTFTSGRLISPPTDLRPHGRDEQRDPRVNQAYTDVRGARDIKHRSLGRGNPGASRSVPYLNETHNLGGTSRNFSSADLLKDTPGDRFTRPGKPSNDLPGDGIGGYGHEGSKGVGRKRSRKDPEKKQQDTERFAAAERQSPGPSGSTPAIYPPVSNTKNEPVNRSRATENSQFDSQIFRPPEAKHHQNPVSQPTTGTRKPDGLGPSDGQRTVGTAPTSQRYEGLDEVPKKKWWQCC